MAVAEGAIVRKANPLEQSGFWRDAWKRMRQHRAATAGMGVVAVFLFVAVFADVIAPRSTSEQFLTAPVAGANPDPLAKRDTGKYETPSTEHWFGTDQLARDIFSRTVVGCESHSRRRCSRSR